MEDLNGFDAMIFLGGLSNDPMAQFRPDLNFNGNCSIPTYLAYICKQAGIKRFICASSCSVYGFTDNQTLTETDFVKPAYAYGISKLQCENGLMILEDDNFKPIMFRKGTVGGFSPRMRYDLVVNTMIMSGLSKGKITVNSANLWRPLIDIRDVIQGYRLALESDLSISGVFNLSGFNYTIGELQKEDEIILLPNPVEWSSVIPKAIGDLNNDGIVDSNDRTILGNPNPDYIYGFNFNLRYKRFSMSALLNGIYGNDVANGNLLFTDYAIGSSLNISPDAYYNAWRPTAESNTYPRIGYNAIGNALTDRIIEDGSFLRLNNVTLKYDVPVKDSKFFTNLSLHVTGQNLYTWTNYSGFNPEITSFQYDGLIQGVDWNSAPNAKTFLLRLNITF